jgi:glycine/D-amino acid oxidase-like deaminating enzyme
MRYDAAVIGGGIAGARAPTLAEGGPESSSSKTEDLAGRSRRWGASGRSCSNCGSAFRSACGRCRGGRG